MATTWIETMIVRGGTSKGLFFTDAELSLEPPEGQLAPRPASHPDRLRERDVTLCAALGSPDPFGRQLNGMGGGVSSLSKAMIVGRSQRPGIDLDYLFAQVPVDGTVVDYSGNCGNLSSGVVPFALAAGLVARDDGPQRFALHNVNTGKRVDVRLTVEGGRAAVHGDLALPGVAGEGSLIDLVYPTPGGSRTASVLPTGVAAQTVTAGGREVRVSIVDVAIPLVLVPAAEVGLTGAEAPAAMDADAELMSLLEEVRRAGARLAGLCDAAGEAIPLAVPKVAVVAPPAEATLLDGTTQPAAAADVLVRTISMGRAHGAIPGTGAMCVATAALIPGTVVAEAIGRAAASTTRGVQAGEGSLTTRIGTPSGVVTASARLAAPHPEPALGMTDVPSNPAVPVAPVVAETTLARTARILMRGEVAIDR